jgi:guanine deaminase
MQQHTLSRKRERVRERVSRQIERLFKNEALYWLHTHSNMTLRTPTLTAFRAAILHFLADPGSGDDARTYEHFDDGILLVENGKIAALGDAAQLLPTLQPDLPVTDYRGKLIVPGFIDTHLHFPQTDVIASAGNNLLDWLEHYTFPAERRFGNLEHSREVANFFCDELLRNGTTTALVFGTVHPESVEAIFEAAENRNMRLLAGKALMDRNCPDYLQDTPARAYSESSALIEKWNARARLNYAITPRFAPTSSEAQLAEIGRLAREHPDVHLQSHLAENLDEIAWVREVFPWSRSYLDVYDRYGLLRERAIYAHCIHLADDDRQRMASTGAAAAFCPTSNLYLGSGLFDIERADAAGMAFSVATDVGGGTSFNLLRTLGEAYKVAQMKNQRLTPLRAFYLVTLGAARVLHLDDRIGSFVTGREADFVVLDPRATPLTARRDVAATTLTERLRALMTLGDDRAVHETYILGKPAKLHA